MTTLLAFDPGLTGAVAVRNRIVGVAVWDLPTRATSSGTVKRELDARELAAMLYLLSRPAVAIVERTHAMPGQGVASMFSMGVTRGVILGVLGALAVESTEVEPRVWKRAYGLTADKKSSILKARAMFPSLAPLLMREKDHNRAEALLMLDYLEKSRSKP
jgi:crossover junction endodeoxyribonuclease RuvC